MDEITAEFETETVKKTAESLKTKKTIGWTPIVVGLITTIGMAVVCYILWSKGVRVFQ